MVTGSCLCGGVAFEIEGRVTPIQLCHARRCQKFTGSAFAPELAAKADRFRWVRGEELVATCRVCGSPLPAPLEGTEFVVLLAGVLDGDPDAAPFRHIFTGQAAPWDRIADDLPAFEGRPPAEQRLQPTRPRR